MSNIIDLDKSSFDEIREALVKRSEYKQFLGEQDRSDIIEFIGEFDWGWLIDEPLTAILILRTRTIFNYDCMTDRELFDYVKYVIESLGIDETSPMNEVKVANIIAKYELEQALEL